MRVIVMIAGSPSAPSRSAGVLDVAATRLAVQAVDTHLISVRELDAGALLTGQYNSPALQPAIQQVLDADGVIVATPVYKAAYTGTLKTFLDVLPPNALAGKPILPIVTGGSPAHSLALDYALRPVLVALGAEAVLNGLYIMDSQMTPAQDSHAQGEKSGLELESAIDERLTAQLTLLLRAVRLRHATS